MWKQLITTGLLTAALVALPGETLADHRDRRDGWEHRDDRRHWEHRQRSRHWQQRQHRRDHWRWRQHNRHYWNGRWYRTPPRYRGQVDWGPNYLGGALIGSAITYSLLHDRDDHRYCDHGRRGRRR